MSLRTPVPTSRGMLKAMQPDQPSTSEPAEQKPEDQHAASQHSASASPASTKSSTDSPISTQPPASTSASAAARAGAGMRRRVGQRINSFFASPKKADAFGEVPEGQNLETPEPIAALHPVATGFLGTIGVGLALGGYYVLTNVGELITWIAIALFIALGLDPVVRAMTGHGMSRPMAVTLTMIGLLAVFGGFMALIIPTLVTQITSFITDAPTYVDDILNSQWLTQIDRQYALSERVNDEVNRFFGDSGAISNVFGGVLGVSQTVAQSMFGVLIVLVLAIYFLASLPAIMGFGLRLAPRSKRERVAELTNRITRSVGNYVMGQATVAFLNCLVALLLMLILKVPFAALLTLVVAVLAFIPLVGGVIAGIVVTLITLTMGWQSALIYAICYFGYLQVEAYFVSPRIMRKAVAVPGAVAVISVIGGGALAGVTGALMAIPVAASAMMLLREVFIARQDRL